MINEIDVLHSNNTWKLVSLVPKKFIVGYRWTFSIKCSPDNTIKARLVVKRYTQVYSVDYIDTFSLMTKIAYFFSFLSLIVVFQRTLYHFNIKNVLLGDLFEEIYIEQLTGFVAQEETSLVPKKSLCGLK